MTVAVAAAPGRLHQEEQAGCLHQGGDPSDAQHPPPCAGNKCEPAQGVMHYLLCDCYKGGMQIQADLDITGQA